MSEIPQFKEPDGVGRRWRQVTAPLRLLPDFLIPGEAKCGTTSLFRYLAEHQDVLPSDVKEPNNFWRFGPSPLWCRQHYPFCWVRTWRNLSGKKSVTGEASPEYLSKKSVPAAIASLCPAARLIFLFRDPVERAFSDHHMMTKAGVETVGFSDRVEQSIRMIEDSGMTEVIDGLAQLEHHPLRHVLRGCYLRSLQPWLDKFSSDQMLFIESESFFADPSATVNRVLDFLGLEPLARKEWPVFKQGRDKQQIPAAVRTQLESFYKPFNEELAAFLGERWSWM